MDTPAIVVAGVSSGVGKTTVAVGLMQALRDTGLKVQPFKVGPDFLDPMQHQAACNVPSVNLDGWMLGRSTCLQSYAAACKASGADIAVVEGVMGLHDGLDGMSEAGSTAEIAKWLGVPVVLVLDAWCLSRSAAAMVLGYSSFDPNILVKGVIFNRVNTQSHAEWLRQGMLSHRDTASTSILGSLPRDVRIHIPERYLGLHRPRHDASDAQAHDRLSILSRIIQSAVNLTALLDIARTHAPAAAAHRRATLRPSPLFSLRDEALPRVRIGVAQDAAFCFYYADNLRLLEAAGAQLVPFSPITDSCLPHVDALIFGGGYPELYAQALSENAAMRKAVGDFAGQGKFVWAECGGLMYLARSLRTLPDEKSDSLSSQTWEMCGVLPISVAMTPALTMGYCTASLTRASSGILRLPLASRCVWRQVGEGAVDKTAGADQRLLLHVIASELSCSCHTPPPPGLNTVLVFPSLPFPRHHTSRSIHALLSSSSQHREPGLPQIRGCGCRRRAGAATRRAWQQLRLAWRRLPGLQRADGAPYRRARLGRSVQLAHHRLLLPPAPRVTPAAGACHCGRSARQRLRGVPPAECDGNSCRHSRG